MRAGEHSSSFSSRVFPPLLVLFLAPLPCSAARLPSLRLPPPPASASLSQEGLGQALGSREVRVDRMIMGKINEVESEAGPRS